MEGIAGPIAHTHLVRFRTAQDADELRALVRQLIRETPRLRARPVPTLFGWRLAVLPEGDAVDRLSDRAWRIVPEVGADEEALRRFVTQVINEPFELESELPLRVYLIEGGAQPLLLFSVQHMVCDGRGMMELMARLMARLNGQQAQPVPMDSPSMVPALLPSPPTFINSLRSLWRSFWLSRRDGVTRRRLTPLLAGTPGPAFGRTGVRIYRSLASLPALKEAAHRHGCTVTELMIAALATGFGRDREPDGQSAILVRLSIDLRPYFPAERRPAFGNFVASFVVSLPRWRELTTTIAEVRAQIRDNVGRFERKEMSFPLIAAELTPRLLGRALLGRAAQALKRRGRLQPVTFHYSNLGNLESLNRFGARAQLDQLTTFGPAVGPFFCSGGLADRLSLGITYPAAEIDEVEIDEVLKSAERALAS